MPSKYIPSKRTIVIAAKVARLTALLDRHERVGTAPESATHVGRLLAIPVASMVSSPSYREQYNRLQEMVKVYVSLQPVMPRKPHGAKGDRLAQIREDFSAALDYYKESGETPKTLVEISQRAGLSNSAYLYDPGCTDLMIIARYIVANRKEPRNVLPIREKRTKGAGSKESAKKRRLELRKRMDEAKREINGHPLDTREGGIAAYPFVHARDAINEA